ncbi:hypothetical protein AAF712_003210 [Marasmius tenuissimus]|uniref:Cytochrome P450 n=1 Tax=Marasmius tenuissimus TaxID=585030 RepID=A0ABR3AAI2_9AGAR
MGPIGASIKTRWWQVGLDFTWERRQELYRNHETISSIPWLFGAPVLYTTNIDVMRQIISVGQTRSTFIKSPESVVGGGLYGENVLTTEGNEWRKHRRIVGPAFGNSLYQLVWDQSLQTYRDMVAGEGWSGKKSVEVPTLQDATFKFALIVLGVCAFGFDFNWASPLASPGGDMSVQEAMRTVIDKWIFIIFAPGWLKSLPFPSFKHTLKAYAQLECFMQEQVKLRREEIRGHAAGEYKRKDAFSMLVQANESDENAKNNLSDRDLIGNVFVMLFAGHETTAHTLAATLALLAVTLDAQDEVLQQIIDVVGWDRDPEFGDYHNLNKALAAFYEALRLFPAAYMLVREPNKDFVLDIPNPRGQEGTQPCPLPKGTWTLIDMIGLQRNPRYFEDPEEYRPSRWHTMPNDSELFTGFSIGSRACIGRKFATTEAIAFLTMFLRDWKVEPLLQAGETVDSWKKRVLDANVQFTLSCNTVPVRFTRRERP